MYSRVWWSWTVALSLALGYLSHVYTSSMHMVQFEQLGTGWRMAPVGPSTIKSSVLACAVKVLNMTVNYNQSFTYNNITKLCTPGSAPYSSPNATSTDGDKLYAKQRPNNTTTIPAECNPNFSKITYDNTTACLLVANGTDQFYATATNTCLSYGASLVSVKTVEKLNFLKNLSLGSEFFVGADDLDLKGTYVWKEDGTPVINSDVDLIFYNPAKLTQKNPQKDCIKYDACEEMLDVSDCRDDLAYLVCEIPIE